MANNDPIETAVNKLDDKYRADISGQVTQLREDLANLANTVKSLGSDVTHDVKEKASRLADDAISASNSAARSVKHEVRSLNDNVTDYVQTNPIQSIGIAAATGFLLAILTRR
jgi:ElaB/YqjD/DUF883 family membrane-anchored ribosome-binding protein